MPRCEAADPERADRRRALLLLALLAVVWGVNWPIMKVAVEGVGPWTFRALTTVVGGAGMLVLARLAGQPLALPVDQLRWVLIVAPFSIGGWMVFTALGIALMGSGRAAILAYTMPLWAVIFARFALGEALTPSRFAGLVLGLAGVAVLLARDHAAIEDAPLGAVFMLAAAVSWGLGTVLFKKAPWRRGVLVIVGWQLVLVGLPVTAVALLVEGWRVDADAWAWLALAYNVAISGTLGFWAWNRIVTLLPAGAAAVGSLAVPVIGVVSGGFLLGEAVGWREGAALALVLAAIAAVMGKAGARGPR